VLFLALLPGARTGATHELPGGPSDLRNALTDDQRAWLETHPSITVAFDGTFPPYSYRDEGGTFRGLSVDLVHRIAAGLGLGLTVYPDGVWKNLYAAAQRREVDVVATMVERPERREWFAFTRPYVFKTLTVMVRTDDDRIRTREDLAGKKVAVVESYQYVPALLAELPTLVPYKVDTMLAALEAVATGRADAAVTFFGAGYWLATWNLLSNLRFGPVLDRTPSKESFGVRGDWPELAAIFDRALGALEEAELPGLRKRWNSDETLLPSPTLTLTPEQRRWIAAHPTVRVGPEAAFPPMAFGDETGAFRGISADLLARLGSMLGVRFAPGEPADLAVLLERARRGQVDVVTSLQDTPQRREYLRFTRPYARVPVAIVAREDGPRTLRLEGLIGQNVAVGEGYAVRAFLAREQPGLTLVDVPNDEVGLEQLAFGQVDAAVVDVATASYLIDTRKITGLRVAGDTGFAYEYRLAVRKDWPVLHALLDEALAALPPPELQEIVDRWIHLSAPRSGIHPGWLYAFGGVLTLALATLTGVGLWNRTLRKRVTHRTRELQAELAARTEAEADARASKERLQAILDNTPAVIYIKDLEGRYLLANRRFLEIFHLRPEQVLGRTDHNVHPAEIAEAVRANDRAVVAAGAPVELDEQVLQDGRLHDYLSVKFPLHDDVGRIAAVCGISTDITERQKTRGELERRASELAAVNTLTREAGASLVRQRVVDAVLDRVVEVVRPDTALVFLRRGGDLVLAGQRAPDPRYAHGETPPHRVGECLCGRVLERGEPCFSSDIHADPRCTWTECKAAGLNAFAALPLTAGGTVLGVLGLGAAANRPFDDDAPFLEALASAAALSLQNALLFEQVTDQSKMLERRVAERTAELESANAKLLELDRLKSLFIASMSHELRTPLNSIIGFSGVLLKGLAGPLNDEQRDQLQRVSRAGKLLLSLVTDVIDIAKIESGKITPYPGSFPLGPLLEEAKDAVAKDAADKGLALSVVLDPDTLELHTDRRRLHQCLLNLLSNAVKFTAAGAVAVEARGEGDQVTIAVADTGPGIAPEDLGRLFGSFVRLVTPGQATVPGTGLGLYLTRKLAREILGGEVSVESTLGAGSRFTLQLPRQWREPEEG
jgi:PAS domain S-box-containing protein